MITKMYQPRAAERATNQSLDSFLDVAAANFRFVNGRWHLNIYTVKDLLSYWQRGSERTRVRNASAIVITVVLLSVFHLTFSFYVTGSFL